MNLTANDRAIVASLCQNYRKSDGAKRAALRAINNDALVGLRARRRALQHEMRNIARAIAMRELFDSEVDT